MTTEAEVSRAFVELLDVQPWAKVLPTRPPQGRAGSAKRAKFEAERRAAYREAAAFLEATPIGVVLWRRNTSALKSPRGMPVVGGLTGEYDFDGIAKPLGRKVAVEMKAPGGKLRDDQRAVGDLYTAGGVVHLVVDEPEAGVAALGRAVGALA